MGFPGTQYTCMVRDLLTIKLRGGGGGIYEGSQGHKSFFFNILPQKLPWNGGEGGILHIREGGGHEHFLCIQWGLWIFLPSQNISTPSLHAVIVDNFLNETIWLSLTFIIYWYASLITGIHNMKIYICIMFCDLTIE